MATRLAADTTISLKPALAASELDDEVVVLDLERGEYYGLRGSARQLWLTLSEGELTIEQILDDWIHKFGNDSQDVDEYLRRAVELLVDNDIIAVST
jgi:hypothetical protein